MKVVKGQKVTLTVNDQPFEFLCADPDGMGKGVPTFIFGLRMMERHSGLKNDVSSEWITKGSAFEGAGSIEKKSLEPSEGKASRVLVVQESEGDNSIEEKWLETPGGKRFRVAVIRGLDGNQYTGLEVSDWVEVAKDVILHPKGKGRGKPVSATTIEKLVEFISHFTVKGIYADIMVAVKGSYTKHESTAVDNWLNSRMGGKQFRVSFTTYLVTHHEADGRFIAQATNHIYEELFGKTAKQMKDTWKLIAGNPKIGRNYIPEAVGLEAVAFVERRIVEDAYDDLIDGMQDAITAARRKFKLTIH